MSAAPSHPPYSTKGERQGEAITLVLDADQQRQTDRSRQGAYTIGEATDAPLYFYQAQRP